MSVKIKELEIENLVRGGSNFVVDFEPNSFQAPNPLYFQFTKNG